MVNLRLLAFRDHKGIKSVSLPHGLDLLPENLRYFQWDGYPWKSLPATFCPEMLVELSLQESSVEKLWNGVNMNLPNLEILDLSRSKKLIECPNVSGSPNLKHVILHSCESLPEVDSSIFLLKKLEGLFIDGCTSLKSLSSNTCSPALIELNAFDCINLQEFSVNFASVDNLGLSLSKWGGNELTSSILHIKNLKVFVFPMIECLVDLPENFAECIWLVRPMNCERNNPSIILPNILSSPAFTSVELLILFDIPNLTEIPNNIFLLSSLEYLVLTNLAIKSLPENIKYLPRLCRLYVYHCKMLQSIPVLSPFISNFIVWNCESLQSVLSSTSEYDQTIPCFNILLNCIKLDPHSYQKVLKYAIDGIELGARQNSQYGDYIVWNLLPDMPGREYWFSYLSTQVSFTLELPPNLLGFAYYLVLSQGYVREGAGFGCECYLDNSSGETICITSLATADMHDFRWDNNTSFHMMSDHVVIWYDPIICKQIMEDVNRSSYNSTLRLRFFVDDTLIDEVTIQECGFRWIYQEESVPPTNFEPNETKDMRCLLEELMHIGFGGDLMNPLLVGEEKKE